MNDIQHGTGRPPAPLPPPAPGQQSDDVWGVRRPPALGPQPQDTPFGGHGPHEGERPWGQDRQEGTGAVDRGLAALRKAPLRRDTAHGVLGGVCAGIAQRAGISVAAVRVGAVALALFLGTGLGAYLLLWALLPDQTGATHAEHGVKDGNPGSLVVLGLGALAALGVLSVVFDGLGWLVPVAVAASVVYVVMRKKGRFCSHTHG